MLYIYSLWLRKSEVVGSSFKFVRLLIENLSTSISGTLRGRYRMPSGIILYQTTSADTV
jgi:hypothetical protein